MRAAPRQKPGGALQFRGGGKTPGNLYNTVTGPAGADFGLVASFAGWGCLLFSAAVGGSRA